MMKLDDIAMSMPCANLRADAGIQITEAPGAAMNRGKESTLKEVITNASARILPHPAYARAWPEGRRGPPYLGGVIWAERCRSSGSSVLLRGRSRRIPQLEGLQGEEMIEANVAVEGGGGARDPFL